MQWFTKGQRAIKLCAVFVCVERTHGGNIHIFASPNGERSGGGKRILISKLHVLSASPSCLFANYFSHKRPDPKPWHCVSPKTLLAAWRMPDKMLTKEQSLKRYHTGPLCFRKINTTSSRSQSNKLPAHQQRTHLLPLWSLRSWLTFHYDPHHMFSTQPINKMNNATKRPDVTGLDSGAKDPSWPYSHTSQSHTDLQPLACANPFASNFNLFSCSTHSKRSSPLLICVCLSRAGTSNSFFWQRLSETSWGSDNSNQSEHLGRFKKHKASTIQTTGHVCNVNPILSGRFVACPSSTTVSDSTRATSAQCSFVKQESFLVVDGRKGAPASKKFSVQK